MEKLHEIAEKLYLLSENGEKHEDSEAVIDLIESGLQKLKESEDMEDVVLITTLEMLAEKRG